MPVTITDVARHANVSIKTVSRVINNEVPVKESTRRRVLEAIDELGYQPNILARSLVQQRSYTIAVISWRLDRVDPAQFVTGIQEELDRQGYSILLTILNEHDEHRVDEVLNNMASRRVDGIIWHVPRIGRNQDWINPKRLAQMPPVVINSLPNPHVTTVSIDNYHGARLAVQHLIDQGWRRIGLITGPIRNPIFSEKYRGWRDALLENGIEPDESLAAHAIYAIPSGEQAASDLLARHGANLDAIFASNDWIALGAMRAIHRAGRVLCHDIGLIGYGDHPESEYFMPSLSTVHQDIVELGHHAVRHLVDLIDRKITEENHPAHARLTVLKPRLMVRESSLRHQ